MMETRLKPALIVLIMISAFSLVACSGKPARHSSNAKAVNSSVAKLPGKRTRALSSKSTVLKRLKQQYAAWRGVPYKIGGNDKRGIDCSGFVHMAIKNALGVNVPRSTRLLAKTGTNISSRHLRPGDLVFFKTGWGKRHVGIYLENGHFMHASTSKGVMKSKLNNPYWRKHYWKSARIM